MSEDRPHVRPSGPGSAPWDRPWAVSPPTQPPTNQGRAARGDDAGTAVSVAELLRRAGHRVGTARRHAEAEAEPEGKAEGEADTVVLPVVPAPEHAPLGAPPREAPTAGPGEKVPQTRLQTKKTRRRRRVALAGRFAVALVALLVLGVTGTAWGALHYVDSKVRTVQALDPVSPAIQQPEKQLGDENFLLVGSDSRAGASGKIGAGTESDVGGARSDTTMLAHIPADRSRIVVVSFPRDLQVDIPACQAWDNDTATYTKETFVPQQGVKLNQAYFEGGPRCTTKVVQQLSGLNVNHFLGVDFSGFEAMVNAVDGVQVCSPTPIQDTTLGTVLAKSGPQTLNGAQALNYVRARHVIGDPTSDYGRIQRQQRFLSSLLRAALSSDTLLNIGRLKGLVDAVTASTFGERVGPKDLLGLAQSLQSLQAGRVTFITAPTTGEANSAGNEVLRPDANAALFQAIRDGAPLPGEKKETTAAAPTTTVPPPPPVTAVDPATIALQVLNDTDVAGLAGDVAGALVPFGFTAAPGNATDAVTGVQVRYSAGQEAAAATVASAVPGARLTPTPGLGAGVQLVLGTDVRGTLVAPTAVGLAVPSNLAPSTAPPRPAPLPDNLTVVNGGDTTCS